MSRTKTVCREEILEAIREYGTKSPSALATNLNVERTTIWRRMKEIKEEEIEAVFKDYAETELKPYQMKLEVFLQISEVREYQEKLRAREVSPRNEKQNLRYLWRFCVYLKRHPSKLSVKESAETLQKLKRKRVKGLAYDNTRYMLRSWFENKGVSGELLTSHGINGEVSETFGSRAHDRLTQEERHRFLEALREITNNDPYYCALPKWLYYTGTRIDASLKVRIEKITWNGNGSGKAFVIDKGKHKKGREKWYKIIVGELKTEVQGLIGDRKEGFLFNGLQYKDVRKIFRQAYKKAGIKVVQPCHIWRHTSTQDLLDATDWNYEVVASIVGSRDTRTLKLCYGAMGESVRERALRGAMGEVIEVEKTEFKF